MNHKGFTLIELLATMAVLAVLMLLAIPNVIGVVQKNKNNAYIEDAKKLVTLAEYKINSDPNVKPTKGKSVCLYMEYLDLSNELDEPPNGGKYDRNNSYVHVTKQEGELKYKVQLIEKKNDISIGLAQITREELFQDNATSNVQTNVKIQTCSCLNNCHYRNRYDNPTNQPSTGNPYSPYSAPYSSPYSAYRYY